MAGKYFGTDGIRGRANTPKMDAELSLRVGLAAATVLKSKGERTRVVIGKDTRLSGYMIENALTAGLISAGVDVLLLGPMPTPAVSLLTRSMRADLGIMITASHNPHSDNGIKLFGADGRKVCDETQAAIEKLIDDRAGVIRAEPQALGRATRLEGVHARYIEFAKRTLPKPLELSGMRIVIDAANGAGYRVAPEALWEIGAEVISIGTSPNGLNINQECGSTHPEALIEKVKSVRADLGIALDGDADRVVIVDDRGEVIDGNHLLGFFATEWSARGWLKGDQLVTTEMANLGLEQYLSQLGIKLKRTKVGDRFVTEAMEEGRFNLGGESSGHIIFSDFSSTGDGLVAALQLISLLSDKGKRASEVCRPFPLYPERLINVRANNKAILETEEVKTLIKNSKETLGDKGRILVRPSGTEPLIRVLGECQDESSLDLVVELASEIERAAAS